MACVRNDSLSFLQGTTRCIKFGVRRCGNLERLASNPCPSRVPLLPPNTPPLFLSQFIGYTDAHPPVSQAGATIKKLNK